MTIDVVAKIREHEQLKALRQPHEQVWKDCFDFTHPQRGIGFYDETEDATAAQSRKARLTDATATDAARTCSTMIHGGMTPANSQWLGLEVGNDSDDERLWLGGAAETLWENITMSNFDAAGFEASQDGVDAGWFALYVDEAPEGGFHFEQWPIAQVYCAASKSGGLIDIVHRRYKLTALQCVSVFGEDSVSDATRKLAEKSPQELVEILHIIEPRQTYVVNAQVARNLPIASCHIELKSKTLLRESGYHEMPVMVPRWSMIPGSVYATGLVSDALPTIKRLNEVVKMQMAAAELAISGMWIAEDDGVINTRTATVGPRKVIIARSTNSMKPLLTGSDFNVAEVTISNFRADVRKMLLADQLQPQDGPAMTATEVHARVQLIRQQLGPHFGRLQAEYLTPLVTRCFGLAFRAGIFLPPPDSLRGKNISVKYTSPLARAQKLEEVTAIQQYVAATIQMGATLPEVLDNCDFDEANRLAGIQSGVPSAVIRPIQARDELRKNRVAAQQQAQSQQMQDQLLQQAGTEAIKQAASR